MMRKLALLHERTAEEAALIDAAPAAAPLLAGLSEIYAALKQSHELDEALEGLRGIYFGSALLAAGHSVHEYSLEALKPDGQRESAYRERNGVCVYIYRWVYIKLQHTATHCNIPFIFR